MNMSEGQVMSAQSMALLSFGALVVQVFEWGACILEEIECFWGKGRQSRWFSKTLYLCLRYGMMLLQGTNILLSDLVGTTGDLDICIGTFVFKAVTGELVLLCIELVLLSRACALFSQNWRMRRMLGCLFAFTASLEVYGIYIVVVELRRSTSCVANPAPMSGMVIFGHLPWGNVVPHCDAISDEPSAWLGTFSTELAGVARRDPRTVAGRRGCGRVAGVRGGEDGGWQGGEHGIRVVPVGYVGDRLPADSECHMTRVEMARALSIFRQTTMYTTPSRSRARSEAKTPVTPSLVAGIANLSVNSFSARSRPASPVKRVGSSQPPDSLHKQAAGGVIRKGGVESRLDVVTNDYVPPKTIVKRSKSNPATTRPGTDKRDRFITNRDTTDIAVVSATLDALSLNADGGSPSHTARVAEATGVPLNRRILGYHEQPPPASSSDTMLAQQREFARPLYAQRPSALATSTGTSTNKSRKIPTQPERVLDAPGMVDDFYLNLISWSCQNAVAVALESSTYIWRADTGAVTQLGECPEGSYVSSVQFSADGAFLGIGVGNGDVELWDVEMGQKLRTMSGHQGQIATLSWNQHILSSGCGDGSIWHHDVRVPRHKVMELNGHTGEVCGLAWRSDGELLASGGNDNVVNIWDGRIGDVAEGARGTAKWTKRNHTAAVKAVAWCPWQASLLATGGGTNDASINVWNSTTGARLHTLKTPSQITSIQWSPHRKEILTTHGYPTNSIMLHAYPSMDRVAEIRDAHDSRVLFSCIGPAGDVVCTGAGDENLKFWRIWEVPSENTKKKKTVTDDLAGGRANTTKEGILTIR